MKELIKNQNTEAKKLITDGKKIEKDLKFEFDATERVYNNYKNNI